MRAAWAASATFAHAASSGGIPSPGSRVNDGDPSSESDDESSTATGLLINRDFGKLAASMARRNRTLASIRPDGHPTNRDLS